MSNIFYTVILDLTDNGCFDTGLRIKQNDSGNIVLNVKIVNNGVNFYDASIVPQIAFKRPDGKSLLSVMTPAGGYYEYRIVGTELLVAGPVVMDVKIQDSEGRISTASCKFTCVEDTIGNDPLIPAEKFSPISELIEKAEASATIASESAVSASESAVSASESADAAEEYAEIAKGFTPQGYQDLVVDVADMKRTKQDKTDDSLITTNKTVVGGINELRQDLNKYKDGGYLGVNQYDGSYFNGVVTSNGTVDGNAVFYTAVAKVTQGKTYTISFNQYTSVRSGVFGFSAYPSIGGSANATLVPFGTTEWKNVTVTIPNGVNYITFNILKSDAESATLSQKLADAQVEIGTIATEHSQYVPSNTDLKSSLTQITKWTIEKVLFTNSNVQKLNEADGLRIYKNKLGINLRGLITINSNLTNESILFNIPPSVLKIVNQKWISMKNCSSLTSYTVRINSIGNAYEWGVTNVPIGTYLIDSFIESEE